MNVGRVEQIPRVGRYFTKEIDVLGTSIVVVRSSEDRIRAFHNICRHRGNKLVWNDFPREETSGMCRQFTCTRRPGPNAGCGTSTPATTS